MEAKKAGAGESAEQQYLRRLTEAVADPGLWPNQPSTVRKKMAVQFRSGSSERSAHAVDAKKSKFTAFVTAWVPSLVPNQRSLLGPNDERKDICRGSQ